MDLLWLLPHAAIATHAISSDAILQDSSALLLDLQYSTVIASLSYSDTFALLGCLLIICRYRNRSSPYVNFRAQRKVLRSSAWAANGLAAIVNSPFDTKQPISIGGHCARMSRASFSASDVPLNSPKGARDRRFSSSKEPTDSGM